MLLAASILQPGPGMGLSALSDQVRLQRFVFPGGF